MRSLLPTATLVLVLLSFTVGCPKGESTPQTAECESVGDQCRLEGGALGVCHQHPTADELVCQSQH